MYRLSFSGDAKSFQFAAVLLVKTCLCRDMYIKCYFLLIHF